MLKENPLYKAFNARTDTSLEAHLDAGGDIEAWIDLPDNGLEKMLQDRPPALVYHDEGGAHMAAAQALVERARARGVVITDLYNTKEGRSVAESLNAELALPAAYILATRIYKMETAISSGQEVATHGSSSELTRLKRRLNQIIDTETWTTINSLLPRSEGQELQVAVDIQSDKIMGALPPGIKPDSVLKEETEVLCEALGQLCGIALAHGAAPAPASKLPNDSRAQALGTLIAPAPRLKGKY